jgi:hypothetical protein
MLFNEVVNSWFDITSLTDTFSISGFTWTGPWQNPGLQDDRLATNRLSHGMAQVNDPVSLVIWLVSWEIWSNFLLLHKRN